MVSDWVLVDWFLFSIPSHNWHTKLKTLISFSLWDNEGNIQKFIFLVTAKSSNLPSFLALTSERKVQLTLAWARFVGLIEPQILMGLGTLPHVSLTLYCPKTCYWCPLSTYTLEPPGKIITEIHHSLTPTPSPKFTQNIELHQRRISLDRTERCARVFVLK